MTFMVPIAQGEHTPLTFCNHVQTKLATPILYAIDNFKNVVFFTRT